LYYYAPGDLRVRQNDDGSPDAVFFATRYLGNTLGGDSDRSFIRSTFVVSVELEPPRADALTQATAELRHSGGTDVRLVPIPIQRMSTSLRFAAAATDGAQATTFSGGFLEPQADEILGSFWRQRMFTVFLGNTDAQLLLAALRRGATLMSLAYDMRVRALDSTGRPGSSDTKEETAASGAVPFTLDAARYPDRIRLIDIGDSSPPGYPMLTVSCYDFAEHVNPDIFERSVDFEGMGLQGLPVRTAVKFSADHPDLSSRSIRFPFPVRTDKPFRHRITELYWSGEEVVHPWTQAQQWVSVIDITTAR